MKILFVHNSLRTFVRLDRDILAKSHEIVEIDFRWRPKVLYKLFTELRNCDLVYGWFASHHSYLPVVLGRRYDKRIVVCSSDYDLANDSRYGSMRGGLPKWVNNRIFSMADCVIVPSQFSHQMALANTVLVKEPSKVLVIPHGLPLRDAPTQPKIPRAITVATLHRLTNWRKGVVTFVRAAAQLPSTPFDVVGGCLDNSLAALKKIAGANVVFHGQVTDAERDRLLAQAQVYAQLSYLEGFGLSVAEAMLQECVPVVTRRAALPEVVGDCGIYVEYDQPARAAEGIRRAMTMPELGKRARARVRDLFSLELRAKRLAQVLTGL